MQPELEILNDKSKQLDADIANIVARINCLQEEKNQKINELQNVKLAIQATKEKVQREKISL